MVKRKALLKEIDEFAKSRGVVAQITEGGSHTKFRVGENTTTVPRHSEIGENLAKAIRKQIGMEKKK
ncbi:type II toxin-antitoxin system HicA family toxin [Tersicoccus sp. Bi-70]|uniref:type II toxin-antitoxin system HicA family toxin n=1 Tax=Tersicoccus sp. Bi-70 TaxID=1897634 RepID=UPI0009756666|nr:type II toxin-antitoxin system HicA family toxin [Tersicoccus sp. Bi-70]OMH30670.1 hypothetical protein BGP79_11975 [Tersicoccus sp. Bi-70]